MKSEALTELKAKILESEALEVDGEAVEMWNIMTSCIKRVGKEAFGETKGYQYKKKKRGGGMMKFKMCIG